MKMLRRFTAFTELNCELTNEKAAFGTKWARTKISLSATNLTFKESCKHLKKSYLKIHL